MRILIVDDESSQRDMLKGFLEKQGYEVLAASDGEEALKLFSESPVQLVISDHKMPGMSGDELLEKMKEINPIIHSIMITAFANVDTAVKVMKLGADDFLEKPVDLTSLLQKIQWIEQRISIESEAEIVTETIDIAKLPIKLICDGQAMKEVLSLVQRVAKTPWTVLIKGESGTGKELVARLVHLLSPNKNYPFVEVNCGAIPETLFESELFGHEKGAFTSANSSRRGKFELANNGTIFLDEIGELPLSLQPKLLRALQEKKICRVGSEKDISADARVIAATNRDLKLMISQGIFREDLYYRLNVLEIELPPLRKRKNDIPKLIDFFLKKYSPHIDGLDQDAMSTLLKYPFPGNVRELEHIIQRTSTLCRANVIRLRDLPQEVRYHQVAEQSGSLVDRLEAVEREMILSSLETCDWVQTRAAERMGISERVLRYKMKKYNIKH